jgi:hypothetical protein
MEDLFPNIGFFTGNIFNRTPIQALELCRKGAVLIDVREELIDKLSGSSICQLRTRNKKE